MVLPEEVTVPLPEIKEVWTPPTLTSLDLVSLTHSGICGLNEHNCANAVLS